MNEQFGNKRLEKLAKEKTAFNNCREDMSDVNFKIGGVSYTVKVFGCIVLFALFFGVRIIGRRYVGNPDMTFSIGDIIFWGFIAVIAVLVVVSIIREKKKPPIFVSGKTVFFGGESWTSDNISSVKCTQWLERVEVYSNGKKVLTFPWELDNSELFIAWVRKCGIKFEDCRMKSFQ